MSRNTTMLTTKTWEVRTVLIWVSRISYKSTTVFTINRALNYYIFYFSILKTGFLINFWVLRNYFRSVFFWLILTSAWYSFNYWSSIWMIFYPCFKQFLVITSSSRSLFILCKSLINLPTIVLTLTEFFFNRFNNNFLKNSIRMFFCIFFYWALIPTLDIIFYRTSTSDSFQNLCSSSNIFLYFLI